MDLVAELKTLRTAKGVSQASVAAAIGCDQSAVSYWEKGTSTPSGSARKLLENYIQTLKALPDAPEKASAA